jgi:hypothetical protein
METIEIDRSQVNDEEIAEIVNKMSGNDTDALNLQQLKQEKNLKIEQIGTWIWVSGDTYRIKEKLKEMGFFYSAKKKAWFFNGEKFKLPIRAYFKNLEELEQKFGFSVIV